MPDTTTEPHPESGPMTGKEALLEARGLRKVYSGRPVVENVSLHVAPGEITGLLGPNGAGKTTTFYMIAGLVPPSKGNVYLDGKDVTKMAMHKRAQTGLGYLPQEESIFRKMTVEENLLAVLQTRKRLSKKEQRAKAADLLERFRITHVRKSQAIALSGGEKRRLTIARCLCTDPKLLMLDEPFSGVDPIAVIDIQNIIRELREDDGLAILITDHNVRETLKIVDRAYLLLEGRVVLDGPSEKLANDPVAKRHYLGEDFKL